MTSVVNPLIVVIGVLKPRLRNDEGAGKALIVKDEGAHALSEKVLKPKKASKMIVRV